MSRTHALLAATLALIIASSGAALIHSTSKKQASVAIRPAAAGHSQDDSEAGPPPGADRDYSRPFSGPGDEVSTTAEAQKYVTFQVVAPKGQAPDHIFASKTGNVVGFSFFKPSNAGGWVDLVESLPSAGMTSAQYASQATKVNFPDMQPSQNQVVAVNNGAVKAWLFSSSDGTLGTIQWVDDSLGLQFQLTGQGTSPGMVRSLAAKLVYNTAQ